ncbi:hypothetical protein GGR58DRAFT_501680 [Xylaria digitata]|nr:hypothetical protein GGR58DRAFT_501680 [Xylaria digitata]
MIMIPNVRSVMLCLAAFGLASLQFLILVAATTIPSSTGPYHVGKTRRTIHHHYGHGPLAPKNVGTAFLATIFYPTNQKPKAPPQPYPWGGIAEYYENRWNYTEGFLQSLTSTVQYDTPFLEGSVGQSPFPTIIFGPGGGGPPVDGNTIFLSELAPHGYTIICVDHPWDQAYIQFPNGTAVAGTAWDTWLTLAQVTPVYEIRIIDNKVLLEAFSQLIEELKAPINTSLIGSLGFSLSGAAAIGTIYDEKIVSRLNMDGSLWGKAAANNSSSDAKKPVFLFGHELHLGGDPSWASFPRWQTGSFRYLLVNGTTELDFFDDAFWRLLEPNSQLGGTIDPYRMINITNAYVKAFFDLTLLGQYSPILDGPSKEYPEVLWYDKYGNQYP